MADGHYTNVYDKALGHVANTIHTILANHAVNNVSEEDKAAAKEHALQLLQDEYTQKIRNDPERYNIFTTRLINNILDTFQDRSRDDIDEWRSAWLKGLQDFMEGRMVFVPTEGVSLQAIRQNSKAIEKEIAKRFEEMKSTFLNNALQQLKNNQPSCLERDLEAKWNAYIDSQVDIHKSDAEAEIQTKLRKWADKEEESHAKKLGNRLTSETANVALQTLHEHASAMRYKLVPASATVSEPTGEPFSLVLDSQMTDPIEDPSQPDTIDALARTRSAAIGGAAASIHNPANQMEDDPPSPKETSTLKPNNAPEIPADSNFVKMFMDGISHLTDRFDHFEARLSAIENPQRTKTPKKANQAPKPPPIPSTPRPAPPASKDPRTLLPAPAHKPAQPTQRASTTRATGTTPSTTNTSTRSTRNFGTANQGPPTPAPLTRPHSS